MVSCIDVFMIYGRKHFAIVGVPHLDPFEVAVWYGTSKPTYVNEYLSKFIQESNHLIEHGVEINGFRLLVKVRSIIGDTPARCFVKGYNLIT